MKRIETKEMYTVCDYVFETYKEAVGFADRHLLTKEDIEIETVTFYRKNLVERLLTR